MTATIETEKQLPENLRRLSWSSLQPDLRIFEDVGDTPHIQNQLLRRPKKYPIRPFQLRIREGGLSEVGYVG
jgi:hypothetical protein